MSVIYQLVTKKGDERVQKILRISIQMTFPKIGTSDSPVNNRPNSYNNGSATINFTYDNTGNMTAAGATTYQWDGANRLKSVNGGTYYIYSCAVMEVASAGVQRAYVMNGGSVVAQRNPDGNFYWLHADHLGSGRKMTNTSGNLTYRAEFDPYGKLSYEWSATPNQNTKKFTGYERDAGSGLDYAQARMYASEWGRFLSPDPIGMASVDKLSPKTLNAYAYVNGNPVNATDPTGLGPSLPTNNGSDRPNPAFIATGGYAVCIGEIMRRLYYNYAAQFLSNAYQGSSSSGNNGQQSPPPLVKVGGVKLVISDMVFNFHPEKLKFPDGQLSGSEYTGYGRTGNYYFTDSNCNPLSSQSLLQYKFKEEVTVSNIYYSNIEDAGTLQAIANGLKQNPDEFAFPSGTVIDQWGIFSNRLDVWSRVLARIKGSFTFTLSQDYFLFEGANKLKVGHNTNYVSGEAIDGEFFYNVDIVRDEVQGYRNCS